MSEWVTIFEADDRIEAENIKNALMAQGIMAEIFQEGVAHYAYTLAHSPMSVARVCVPEEQIAAAQAWLEHYERGDWQDTTLKFDEENGDNS